MKLTSGVLFKSEARFVAWIQYTRHQISYLDKNLLESIENEALKAE